MSAVWGSPKNVFVGTNSDGTSYKVIEWDYKTFAGYDIIRKIFVLIGLALLGSILSPILVILSLFSLSGRVSGANTFGLLIGSYVLLDFYKGWLMITTLNLILPEYMINTLVWINIAALIAHVLIMIFGWEIYKSVDKSPDKAKKSLAMSAVIVLFVAAIISCSITAGHQGWVQKNIDGDTQVTTNN